MDPTQTADAGATESYSKMTNEAQPATPPASESGPDPTLKNIDITITDNGGYIVRCQHTQKTSGKGDVGPYQEPSQYAFGTRAELDAFLDQKLGAPAAEDGDEGETQA